MTSANSKVTHVHRFMLLRTFIKISINWGINSHHESLGRSDTVDKNINTKKILSNELLSETCCFYLPIEYTGKVGGLTIN